MRHRGSTSCLTLLKVVLFSIFSLSAGAPVVTLPLNSQIPPVAVANQPFSFQFSASTFQSTSSSLNYTLQGSPSWLQLDSDTRTLTGIPTSEDLGAVNLSVGATDTTGSTSIPLTLVVIAEQGPGINLAASKQPQTSGTTTASDEFLFYPSQSISIVFPNDTFTNTDPSSVYYYATSANNTPLPSWLIFNDQGLSFAGLAPSSTSPLELPQTFAVRLAVSNVSGFFTAQTTFTITLESHQFYFQNDNFTIDVTPGQYMTYSGLTGMLLIDSKPAPESDLRSVNALTPAWLSFDNTTLSFSGTAPIDVTPGSIIVSAEDTYGNTANVTILVNVAPKEDLIVKELEPLQAVIGHGFRYELDRSDFGSRQVNTTINVGNASSWLAYDNSSLVLSGEVPTDILPQTISLILTATQSTTSQSESVVLHIVTGSNAQVSQAATTSQTPATPTQSFQSMLATASSEDDWKIAVGITVPAIVFLALLLLYCYLKRRKRSMHGRQFTEKPRLISSAPATSMRWDQQFKLSSRHQQPSYPGYSSFPQGTGPVTQGRRHIVPFKRPASSISTSHTRPIRPLLPLSDIGLQSRPTSFVNRVIGSRRSGQSQSREGHGQQYQHLAGNEHSISRSDLGRRPPHDVRALRLLQNGINSRQTSRRHGNPEAVKPLRRARQSLGAHRGRTDLPGRRSIHGLGHGQPFPEYDPRSREDSGLSHGSDAWTDTSDSSQAAMNTPSRQGSYLGYPLRAHLVPQTVRVEWPTIRPVGPSPPESAQAKQETATTGSRSLPRPPSYSTFVSARYEVVRKLRETDSTSFSGYRSTRKSSSGREDGELSPMDDEVPAIPPRHRPPLDSEDAERASAFYASHRPSTAAQRKGSLIHHRFEDPCTDDESLSMSPPAPLVPRRAVQRGLGQLSVFPSVARRRSRSSAHLEVQSGAGMADDWSGEDTFSDAGRGLSSDIIVPEPLRIQHSWAAGEEHPEEDQASLPEDEHTRLVPDLADETHSTSTVERRQFDHGLDTGDLSSVLTSAQNAHANELRRDISMRFI